MLFQVRMDVSIPRDLPEQERARFLAEEKQRAQDLQRQGVWLHLWRVVGCYSNISIFDVDSNDISIFDVDSNDALHEVLWTLPLFPFMQVEVTPLARHPSAIEAG
jgi:muconolactone D-isomerase